MESICRLCCSTKFVNNYLFDEENALYLKMELYLPFKVKKMDRLPQKVCDRCSCKVNDLFQFCNEAIEAQDRLKEMLRHVETNFNDSVDLTLTKEEILPSPSVTIKKEQSTQTELGVDITELKEPVPIDPSANVEVQIKIEPALFSPAIVKAEDKEDPDMVESSHFGNTADVYSDNSEDNVSLVSLKKKKRSRKLDSNGEVKRGRKRKTKDWEMLINTLPTETAALVDKPQVPVHMGQLIDFNFKEDASELQVKKEPNDDTYQCCICFTQCFSRNDMLRHYKEHVNAAEEWAAPPPAPPPPAAQPLRCVRCRKIVEASEWASHWRRHWERDRRPYTCALCEKSFREPHQILKHGQTHKMGESNSDPQEITKRFICDLCPEGFVYMRYLLAHRARAHPEAAARALALRCAVCQRSFAHLNSLRRHLRAHSGERNYLCNVCGKALTSREHLKFHIRIHTGYKPNVCKVCGKGFVKKCNLTLHERVHSGEKPHVCSHCGKAFSQRSTLVIHERYHSGARPYVCGLCGRGFVAKGLLSMHLKTTCI